MSFDPARKAGEPTGTSTFLAPVMGNPQNNSRKRYCTMKKINIAGAKSLCAVILIFALLLFSPPAAPMSAEEETPEAQGYKYAVTIEFGSMAFCYDYGAWNVNEMRYTADASSVNPAADTEQGYPGWYGFDGMTNRISVKYSNENENDDENTNRRLAVTLDYRALAATEGVALDGISAEFYSDAALTQKSEKSFTVPHTSPEDDDKTVVYISLSGEPLSDGIKYISDSFSPIGFLTIRVGEISD